jgi:hypothetical protein
MSGIDTKAFFGAVLKAIACTRNHNLDETVHEAGVVQPATRIREFEKEVGDRQLTAVEADQVIAWLELTFRTKLTPDEERDYYLRYIAEVSGSSLALASQAA